MNEERQARLLAEWLEGSSDQAAPEGIDVDVLQAIYVLRPDRAPAPRVSIEEILRVGWSEDEDEDEGPITDPIGLVAEPLERPPGEEDHTEILQRPPEAVDTDGPATLPDAEEPPTILAYEVERTEVSAPDPREVTPAFGGREDTQLGGSNVLPFTPAAPDTSAEFPALATDEPAPPQALAGQLPAAAELGEMVPMQRSRRRWIYGGSGLAAAAALLLFSVMGPLSSQDEARMAPSPAADIGLEQALSGPADAPAAEPAMPAPKAAANEGAAQGGAVAQAPASPANDPAEDRAGAGDAVAELDADLADEWMAAERAPEAEPQEVLEEEADDQAIAGIRTDRSRDLSAAAAGAAPAAATGADAAGKDKKGGESIDASELAALRAEAFPSDYDTLWYLAADLDPDLQSRITRTLDKVNTHLRYDEFADASLTCQPLIDAPDVRVGQDFAYRAATYAWQSGDAAAALNLIERGISRGSANTFLLSMLIYTKGEILSSLGDPDGAAAAYEAAGNLNAARP